MATGLRPDAAMSGLGWALVLRTTRRGEMTEWMGCERPLIRSRRSLTPIEPVRWPDWSIVVKETRPIVEA